MQKMPEQVSMWVVLGSGHEGLEVSVLFGFGCLFVVNDLSLKGTRTNGA